MATNGSDWETVKKSTKKNKTEDARSTSPSKKEKKKLIEQMPIMYHSVPLKASVTRFDAFKEPSEVPPSKPAGNGSTVVAKKVQQVHKTKPAEPKNVKPTVLTEAVKQIELKELQTVLSKVQATFPENPSIWLKDLVSILNLKMDKVPETDPVFQDHPADYPSCLLTGSVRKMLISTMRQCSEQVLHHFMEHCIQAMIADMKQGISTYGYRMFIQLLAFDKPELMLLSLAKYEELMKANQNRVLRCLSIMWAVGQAGIKRLDIGLKIWLALMFNTLNVRALCGYSADYLENLFKMHTNLKPAMKALNEREFFNLMDVFFTPQASLPSSQQKKLQSTFPKLQMIVHGENPQSSLNQFFPHYFSRVTSSNKQIKQEALSGLIICLTVDKTSFSQWRQMYSKSTMKKSGELLNHIDRNWEKLSKTLDKKKLLETVSSFNVTNDDMAARDNTQNLEGFNLCVKSSKGLLAKMDQSHFPWRLLVFLLLAVATGVFVFDVYTHKGYKASKTNQILTDTGVLFYLEHVSKRLQIFTGKAIDWLQENVPHYYAKACEFAGPYLQLFWEKLYELALYLVEVSQPARDWLNEKIPMAIEWVQEMFPIVCAVVWSYLMVAWEFIAMYSIIAWNFSIYYINIATTWLLENVFVGKLSPENILATLSHGLAVLQSYMMGCLQWCYDVLQQYTQYGSTKQQ